MSIIRVPDKGGNCISFRDVDGYLLPPPFKEDIFRECHKLNIREDDVIIINWMRSGTHWLFELVSMLLNNNDVTIPKKKEDNMIEFSDIPTLEAIPSPRVLNTHLQPQVLPEGLRTGACRVIYLIRDPKDVAVSWYTMHTSYSHYEYTGQWQDWLPMFLEGKVDWKSWFDHVRTWEQLFEDNPDVNVHFIHYEDLKLNPIQELQRLSVFLGLDRGITLLEAIATKCTIGRMRSDKMKFTWGEKGVPVHYRKGVVGDWRNHFTVAQYEHFQRVYQEKMMGSRFQARYSAAMD
ncbi:sulfotransferase 1C2A-like [Haliotis asinina]|uniref:sulfotransferase 1C2A-like n=1 Tax=Haliotis asinina TaxID=109174 RepID=UPI0035325DE6